MFSFYKVCIYMCTHVESGSLSRLPRPGILKALARIFFPPSGAKVVMYSSKLISAAKQSSRGFDKNETYLDKIHTPTFAHRHLSPHLLYCALQKLYSASIFISLLSCKLLMSCVCVFISHQTFIVVKKIVPGLSLPVPFCSANFWTRLSMPMFSTFCLNSS